MSLRLTTLMPFCLLLGLLAVGACSSSNDDASGDDKDKSSTDLPNENTSGPGGHGKAPTGSKKSETLLPICPQVAIIRELAGVEDYAREAAAPENLVAAATMLNVTGTCEFKDNGIDIKFELSFAGMRGPKLGGLHNSFPYFIAMVDPSENIIAKQPMNIDLGFSSSHTDAATSEKLHVFLPLNKGDRRMSPDYQVLVGFQLTPEQADTMRKKNNPDAASSP